MQYTDYSLYLNAQYQYMTKKLCSLIDSAEEGDLSILDQHRYILCSRLISRLTQIDTSVSMDNQPYTKEEYKQIEGILNKYLKTNTTYYGFYFDS